MSEMYSVQKVENMKTAKKKVGTVRMCECGHEYFHHSFEKEECGVIYPEYCMCQKFRPAPLRRRK